MSDTWQTPKGTKLYLISLKGKPYLPVAERMIWFREEHPDWTIETEFVFTDENSSIAKATIKNPESRIIATAHKSETKQGFADHLEKSETGSIGRALALCGYGTQFCGEDLDEKERLADAPAAVRLPLKSMADVTNETAKPLQKSLAEDRERHEKQKPPWPSNEEIEQASMDKLNADLAAASEQPNLNCSFDDFPQVENLMSDTPTCGDYVVQFGKYKNQKIKDITKFELSSYMSYLAKKSTGDDHKNVKDFNYNAKAFLKL